MRDYQHAAAVTPNDSTDLTTVAWAFIVGADGTIKVTTYSGDTVTITAKAGFMYRIRVKRIWSAGTAATGIVALW
jgi:hypothetical protein